MDNEQEKTKKASARSFAETKARLMEDVILHLRDPKHFGVRKLSHEEIAVLLSPDESRALSRMTYCTDEKNALAKLRAGLSKFGIKSVTDVFDPSKGCGQSVSSSYLKGFPD